MQPGNGDEMSAQLPEIYEDGAWYYAEGHVDLAAFRDSVVSYELLEAGLSKDELSTLDPAFRPHHIWMRDIRDGDDGYQGEYDERMVVCAEGDDGAEPYTVVTHD